MDISAPTYILSSGRALQLQVEGQHRQSHKISDTGGKSHDKQKADYPALRSSGRASALKSHLVPREARCRFGISTKSERSLVYQPNTEHKPACDELPPSNEPHKLLVHKSKMSLAEKLRPGRLYTYQLR